MLKDQLDKEHRKFFQLLFVRRRERNSPLELTTGRGHTRSVFLEADRQTDTSLSLSLSLSHARRGRNIGKTKLSVLLVLPRRRISEHSRASSCRLKTERFQSRVRKSKKEGGNESEAKRKTETESKAEVQKTSSKAQVRTSYFDSSRTDLSNESKSRFGRTMFLNHFRYFRKCSGFPSQQKNKN